MQAMPGPARLDHLVVAARTLEEGAAWLEGRLGVGLHPGGEHPAFGTHNRLLSLGESYLEVIAVNPDAPAPPRPRWFGLDTPQMRERLAHGPALIHWVAAVPGLPDHPDVLALSRGENRWRLTVPASGELPGGGVERGESAEQALVRELVEEAGVEPLDARLVSVQSNHLIFPNDHVLVYRIERWRDCVATAKGEISAIDWFPADRLPDDATASTRRWIEAALAPSTGSAA